MTDTQQTTGKDRFALDAETLARIENAEAGIETFAYARPEGALPPGKKFRVLLAKAASARAQVQVLNETGENNLHYHTNVDLIYMVMKGEVAFYGVGDRLIGSFKQFEGVKFPQYARYWFASVGTEEAVLLQISGYPDGADTRRRIPCEPPKGPESSRV